MQVREVQRAIRELAQADPVLVNAARVSVAEGLRSAGIELYDNFIWETYDAAMKRARHEPGVDDFQNLREALDVFADERLKRFGQQ